jgi:hypothetical protein
MLTIIGPNGVTLQLAIQMSLPAYQIKVVRLLWVVPAVVICPVVRQGLLLTLTVVFWVFLLFF